MSKRRRILFLSEAHFLKSGFATYAKEILTRLAAMDKFELCEFASYCKSSDEEIRTVPWMVIGNAPLAGDNEGEKRHKNDEMMQFGAYRFDHAALAFKPDIVFSYRDLWTDIFLNESYFREYFHWVNCPTLDSEPPRPYFTESIMNANAVFSWSEFQKNVYQKYGNGKINFIDIASAAIDYQIFSPILDKASLRKSFGLPPDINILGTIQRNQKRKLFPDIIQAFRKFLDRASPEIAKKTFLYLHTSFPEKMGWNINELILEHSLSSKVLTTYICRQCNQCFASFFADARAQCIRCGFAGAIMPNVIMGVSTEDLAKIYNLFDIYIQYAICLHPDTDILTNRGWIPISQVEIGDMAFTHKGRYRKVVNKWKNLPKNNDKKILKVSFWGDYEKIIATEDHKFYSLNNDDLHSEYMSLRELLGSRIRQNQIIPAPSPRKLRFLQPGNLLALIIDDKIQDIEKIDLADYANDNDLVLDNFIEIYGNHDRSYPRYIEVDNEFCRFIGVFCGDGSVNLSKTTSEIKITSNLTSKIRNNELIKKVIMKIKAKNSALGIRKYKDQNAVDIRLCSKLHARCFSDLFKKAEHRQLPDWVVNLPLEKQKEILIGLFWSDGCYSNGMNNKRNRNTSIYTTISKNLANQIKDILRRLRISYSCRIEDYTKRNLRDGGKRKQAYRFELQGDIKSGIFNSKQRNNTRSVYVNNILFVQIKEIEEIDYNGDVYNLEVEEDHTMATRMGHTPQCEGLGIPLIEAASCGIPVIGHDNTAMSDTTRHAKGYLVPPDRKFRELETGADRFMPNNDALVEILLKFFSLPDQLRRKKGFDARQGVMNRYSWDKTAEILAHYFETCELTGKQGKWDSSPTLFMPNQNIPNPESNMEFAEWVYLNILNKPEDAISLKGMITVRDLNFGANFSFGTLNPFTRKDLVDRSLNYIHNKNEMEKQRCGLSQVPYLDYIEVAKQVHKNKVFRK